MGSLWCCELSKVMICSNQWAGRCGTIKIQWPRSLGRTGPAHTSFFAPQAPIIPLPSPSAPSRSSDQSAASPATWQPWQSEPSRRSEPVYALRCLPVWRTVPPRCACGVAVSCEYCRGMYQNRRILRRASIGHTCRRIQRGAIDYITGNASRRSNRGACLRVFRLLVPKPMHYMRCIVRRP